MKTLALAAFLLSSSAAFAGVYADLDATQTVTNFIQWDGTTTYTPTSGHSLVPYAPPAGLGSTWNGSVFSNPPNVPGVLNLSSIVATQADIQSVLAQIPSPYNSVPSPEVVGGAVGATMTFRRGDSVQPRITRSKSLSLDASGNATFNWGALGQAALTGPVQVDANPSTSANIMCSRTSPTDAANTGSITSISIHCTNVSLLSLTLAGLTAAAGAGLTIVGLPSAGTVVDVIVFPSS